MDYELATGRKEKRTERCDFHEDLADEVKDLINEAADENEQNNPEPEEKPTQTTTMEEKKDEGKAGDKPEPKAKPKPKPQLETRYLRFTQENWKLWDTYMQALIAANNGGSAWQYLLKLVAREYEALQIAEEVSA